MVALGIILRVAIKAILYEIDDEKVLKIDKKRLGIDFSPIYNIMISEKIFIEMALSFPGTEQTPHFERIGFKVTRKRMFATYLSENNTANIFLTLEEQRVFCKMRAGNIYPVPNKWGEKGATTFDLGKLPKELIMEALLSAYKEVVKSGKKTSR
jgi:hypothetical protein